MSDAAATAAAAFLGNTSGGNSKKKKKKTKGKKTNPGEEASSSVSTSIVDKKVKKGKHSGSNAVLAKVIKERQARAAAEIAAAKAVKEEEERLFLAEQEKAAREEDTRRKKRERKKAKDAEQKAAGKAMTKAQKLNAAKAAAAREMLLLSGQVTGTNVEEDPSRQKAKVIYGKKKKPRVKHEDTGATVHDMHKPKAYFAENLTTRGLPSEDAAPEASFENSIGVLDEKLAVVNFHSSELEQMDEDELVDDWENVDFDQINIDSLKEYLDDDSDDEKKDMLSKAKVMSKKTPSGPVGNCAQPGTVSVGRRESDNFDLQAIRNQRDCRRRIAMEARSKDCLRSPILCVLGHVDTGKTKILDKIRKTNVQNGEAGGITQQIGATFMPVDEVRIKTADLNKELRLDIKVPGLLIIDTPGHESFTNLRSRGSGLCDISILVIDIMHGLEPQTIESINLLRSRKTPFIVALNKIDRLYDWVPCDNAPIRKSLSTQKRYVIEEFENRSKSIIGELMSQGLNAALYYENDDFKKVVSVVPTSAHTGEGIPDLLLLAVQITQELMTKKIMYSSAFECTCLEVKTVEGLGTTIDVILINGEINDSDILVVCGTRGAIVTKVRALCTPKGIRDIRIKSDYNRNKVIKAAMGIKIAAQNLETAVAGTNVLVYRKDEGDDLEELKLTVQEDLRAMLCRVSVDGRGVYVQASTLGALEALLEFLKQSNIPVSAVSIGTVFKKDVMRASVMLEHMTEYATILAFDVKVDRDASELAEKVGVKIMTADIIYHLFDQFTNYLKRIKDRRKENATADAVFPVILSIKADCIFMKKAPIVLGCDVVEGILKIGTPICIPSIQDAEGEPLVIGKVTSIQKDHVETKLAPKGSSVAVKFEPVEGSLHVSYGRHFDYNHTLYSKITRASIDALKLNFKDDLGKEDWMLVVKMKKIFNIQ